MHDTQTLKVLVNGLHMMMGIELLGYACLIGNNHKNVAQLMPMGKGLKHGREYCKLRNIFGVISWVVVNYAVSI